MEDKKTDKQTVFVRGVSFDVTDQELNDFFSDIGPVRQAFLVKTKGGQKAHKGFGFVQYALQSDAERAAAELNGKELQGRKLQVEVAIKRAPLEERKKKRKQQLQEEVGEGHAEGAEAADVGPTQEQQHQQQQPAKKARPAKPAAAPAAAGKQGGGSEEKHRMTRAVAVGQLTPETVNAAIKLAQAAGEVEEVVSPIPQNLLDQYKLERDGCSGQAFLVVYSSVKQAMAAVAKLHRQAMGPAAGSTGAGAGGKKKKGGKKGGQQQQEEGAGGGVEAGARLWARQVSGEGLHLKRWRLIVRNLPFTATEADLRASFAPSGFIWELTIPRSPDGKGRGFAFVGYTCRAHAERGIKAVNGQQVAGRPVAVDWAVSKAQFDAAAKQQQQPDGKAGKPGKEGSELDSDLEGHSDEEAVPKRGGRHKLGHESDSEAEVEVAPEQERAQLHSVIDSILGDGGSGKDREGKGKGKRPAPEAEAAEEEEEEEEGGWGSGEEEEGDISGEEEETGEESEEESEEEGGDMFGKKALKERSAAQHAALERLDRKLQAKPLGKAAAAAEGAKAGAGDVGAGGEAGSKAREQAPEGATVFIRGLALDVTKQQLQSKLQAFGRVVSCRLVVDKASGRLKGTAFADFADAESAQKAAEACAKARRKEGPGVVVAGRTVDVDVALGQEAVRSLAVQKAGERGPKDKRNLYLAKEGAIAEGSPAWEDMSQQDKNKRKRAAVEKKTKLASPNFLVSSTRLSVRNIPHSWTEKQLRQLFTQAVIERASKAQPRVRQVKILVEEATGAGAPRSKGIGFVEFEDHEHALCALRQLNNNPKPWGKERRPIVEFAIENAKILKAREAKLARSKQQQQRQETPPAGADGGTQQPAAQQQAAGEKEGGRPAKRPRTEQQGVQAEEGAATGGSGDIGADAGGEEGGAAQAQQSKRQRKREIRLKLRAAKQQKLQEAAAAAAAAKEKGSGGKGAAAAELTTDSAHNRAKKRRELRKAKKQGGVAGGVGVTVVQPQPAAAKQPQQQGQGQKAAQRQAPKGGVQQQQQQQQPRQQGQGQRQGPKGKGAGINSKAGKGAQQAQREQQAQQRKRRADDMLDSLVGGMTGGPKKPKQPRKNEGNDKLDRLAAEYRAKFFDGGSKKSGAKAGGGTQPEKSALKRWFD